MPTPPDWPPPMVCASLADARAVLSKAEAAQPDYGWELRKARRGEYWDHKRDYIVAAYKYFGGTRG